MSETYQTRDTALLLIDVLNFHVTFLTDAVAEFTDEAHAAALEISYPTCGHEVMTIDGFLAAVRSD